jgi:L-lactate dehydrogenase complex protein LldG
MDRRRFLSTLRDRPQGPQARASHPTVGGDGVPLPSYRRPLIDLASAFAEEAGTLGVMVRTTSDGDLARVISEVVASGSISTAVVSRDPETAAALPVLQSLGVEILPFDGPRSGADADLGVTGAAFGIAATGTLVVDSARAGGRTASLVPPVHLAILRTSRLLPTPAGLMRAMKDHYPGGPPSQIVLITGPSRTGDIEFVLTVGVHGPKRLWVALIEDGPRPAKAAQGPLLHARRDSNPQPSGP